MPPIEYSDLPDTIVLWPTFGQAENGTYKLDYPVEIAARWIKKKRRVLDGKGSTVAYDGRVIVDREIVVGSLLWRGLLADLPGSGKVSGLVQVKNFDETEDIKGIECERVADFIRYPDTVISSLPPVPSVSNTWNHQAVRWNSNPFRW